MPLILGTVSLPETPLLVWILVAAGILCIAAGAAWGWKKEAKVKPAAEAAVRAASANAQAAADLQSHALTIAGGAAMEPQLAAATTNSTTAAASALEQVKGILDSLKGVTGPNLLMLIGFGLVLVGTVIAYPDITIVVND
jgi:hypothetical protein